MNYASDDEYIDGTYPYKVTEFNFDSNCFKGSLPGLAQV